MTNRLGRLNLIRAWCPKVDALRVPLYRRKNVARLVLVVGVVFAVPFVAFFVYGVVQLLFIDTAPVMVELLGIEYVAADQTTREVFCQLRNLGSTGAILTEVRVNNSVVTTGDPMPIPFPHPGDRYTYVFRYDGPWEGSILITLHTASGRSYPNPVARAPGSEIPPIIDLQAASKNPIERAFGGSSTLVELRLSFLNDFLNYGLSGPPFTAPESSDAQHLISRARTKLTEAQEAYSRGDCESASELAVSVLAFREQAMEAEKNYQAMKTNLLTAIGVAGAIVAVVIVLALRSRRERRRKP